MDTSYLPERFYLNNCRRIFKKFLETHTNLFDVTIMGDDGTCIKCHRFVLAACSSFFEKAFESYAQQKVSSDTNDLVVLLATYKSKNVQRMVDYIYYGKLPDNDNVRHDILIIINSLLFFIINNFVCSRTSMTT